jgi:hypothetical protein
MNPYEHVTANPRGANGSAFDLMSQFGTSPFGSGQQSSPMPGQTQNWQQNQPFYAQPGFNPNPQQNPFFQQQLFNPQQQFQTPNQPWQQFGSGQSFFGQPGNSPWQQQSPWAQQASQLPGNLPVITTRAIEVNVNLPVHRVLGRHPQEIQQYLFNVVLPVLLDGLTKRALAQDVGQSVSSDLRECVVRIQI